MSGIEGRRGGKGKGKKKEEGRNGGATTHVGRVRREGGRRERRQREGEKN